MMYGEILLPLSTIDTYNDLRIPINRMVFYTNVEKLFEKCKKMKEGPDYVQKWMQFENIRQRSHHN